MFSRLLAVTDDNYEEKMVDVVGIYWREKSVAVANQASRRYLETMNFELVRFGETRFGQPLANVLTLITLQLQYFTVFGMINYCAIAGEFLLTCSHNLLQVVLLCQALHSG